MNDMVEGYLDCALWADLRTEDGDSIDDKGIIDCTDAMIVKATKDCENFKELAKDLIPSYLESFDESQMGHDFWLTRNGHGAGFWDRGLDDKLGKDLSKVAESFGSGYLYINDGGMVECD